MSYNTRRTASGPGSGTGRTGATQVNYHQQPSRPVNNANRNPGYTTSNQPSYNSSAQPAYTTQNTGYSTTAPVPPTQPKPQPPPAVTQPTMPAQQPLTAPTAKPPTTPILKQEPPTPTDTPKMDTTENGDGASKPFWKKRPFVKVSNKVKKARQNAKLRRILNPKNALTFLNELRPGGVKFNVREEPGWGYVASVDIDGKTFSGHSLTISKAKVQASEQALKHLLLEQLSKSPPVPTLTDKKEDISIKDDDEDMDTSEREEGGEPKSKKIKTDHPEDDLPWGSLAAFALHKLFAEWQKEGGELGPQDKYDEEMGEEAYFTRRPVPPEFGYPRRFSPSGPFPPRGRGFGPYPPRGPPPPGFGMPRRPALPPPPAANFIKPALPLGGATSSMLPMKKIPDDANKRHPVMILNQLKPNVVYNESREGQPPHVMFNISVEIEGKEYIGRGKNKKEAKKNAAKSALAPLGIVYEEDN